MFILLNFLQIVVTVLMNIFVVFSNKCPPPSWEMVEVGTG